MCSKKSEIVDWSKDFKRQQKLRSILRFPPRYIPYAEKYKIFELFEEMVSQLAYTCPEDHVLFIADYLQQAEQMRDSRRLIIYGPPYYDTADLAEALSIETGIPILRRTDIRDWEFNMQITNAKMLAERVKEIVSEYKYLQNGWIFCDMPSDRSEILNFRNCAIDPTHVFCLQTCVIPPYKRESFYEVPVDWREYRKNMVAVRQMYKDLIREISIGTRSVDCLASDCLRLLRDKRPAACQTLPRVLILGLRGSGRKTQAKMLSEKYNLVYIDFETLYRWAAIQPGWIGDQIRENKPSADRETRYPARLLVTILESRIYRDDCLERGWVLVGFPNILRELTQIDECDTPPNRIIFLDVNPKTCFERVNQRRLNCVTGREYHMTRDPPLEERDRKQALIHPKDKDRNVQREIELLRKHWCAMSEYCGETAVTISGDVRSGEGGDVTTTTGDGDDSGDGLTPGQVFAFVEDAVFKTVPIGAVRNAAKKHDYDIIKEELEDSCNLESCTNMRPAPPPSTPTQNQPTVKIADMMSMLSSPLGSHFEIEEKPLLTDKDTVIDLTDEANIQITGSNYKRNRVSDPTTDISKLEVVVSVYDPVYDNSLESQDQTLNENNNAGGGISDQQKVHPMQLLQRPSEPVQQPTKQTTKTSSVGTETLTVTNEKPAYNPYGLYGREETETVEDNSQMVGDNNQKVADEQNDATVEREASIAESYTFEDDKLIINA